MSEEYSDLINKERVMRNVICINPTHDTIIMYTGKKFPKCPICDNLMVHLVQPMITKHESK